MNIFTTSKARILFVSVPEDAIRFSVENERWLNFTISVWDKAKQTDGTEKIMLPDGDWTLLSLLKDADEEKAASVVDSISPFENRVCYRDYEGSPDEWLDRSDYFDTALESLHSLANYLGCEGNQAILIEETI